MSKKVKVFGERNTGTNYLTMLLMKNLDIVLMRGTVTNDLPNRRSEQAKNLFFKETAFQNLGWKHGKVNLSLVETHRDLHLITFVTLTKNPYSFLLSLYKKPYHNQATPAQSFTTFLNSSWTTQDRENVSIDNIKSPIDLWNIKNKSYKQLIERYPQQTINVRYEDLLRDPQLTLAQISNKARSPLKSTFENIEKSTKKENSTFQDYQTYYLQEEWKAELRAEHIDLINNSLDAELMEFFGYSTLH